MGSSTAGINLHVGLDYISPSIVEREIGNEHVDDNLDFDYCESHPDTGLCGGKMRHAPDNVRIDSCLLWAQRRKTSSSSIDLVAPSQHLGDHPNDLACTPKKKFQRLTQENQRRPYLNSHASLPQTHLSRLNASMGMWTIVPLATLIGIVTTSTPPPGFWIL